MCVTTELVGNIKLRGDRSADLRMPEFYDGNRNRQFLPGQRRDVTYVSRLQCVQAAIQSQIQMLSEVVLVHTSSEFFSKNQMPRLA